MLSGLVEIEIKKKLLDVWKHTAVIFNFVCFLMMRYTLVQ